MYACGVTVYDYCHLGHARSLITFDFLHRVLKHLGYAVTFVRNFTDIDDKIIQRSNEQNIAWQELTTKFIDAFNEDTAALGMIKPTHEPKATDNIQEIIAVIKGLEEKGLAYQVGGDVFYSVRDFDGYGKLSGKDIEDLESGARVGVMESKRDPLDFALWKASKPGEPKWESPWGEGRPGWHIECSAMSMRYLEQTFDIHGGGRDLIFPHHENEIAQSEGCTGKPFAKYWVHNGFVNINAEKMSKSLGNFLTIRDILKEYHAEVIRLFVLSAHYRSPLDYTDQNIYDAASGLERFYLLKERLENFVAAAKESASTQDRSSEITKLQSDFDEALCDDFNSAKVVGAVFEWVRILNKALDENNLALADAESFLQFTKTLQTVLGIFGSPAQDYLSFLKQKITAKGGLSEEQIEALIEERAQAKASKNFARADEIRDELAEKGIQLKDQPGGKTTWSVG